MAGVTVNREVEAVVVSVAQGITRAMTYMADGDLLAAQNLLHDLKGEAVWGFNGKPEGGIAMRCYLHTIEGLYALVRERRIAAQEQVKEQQRKLGMPVSGE